MQVKVFKRSILILSILFLGIVIVGCGNTKGSDSNNKKEIVIGVSPGPYNDLFNDGIAPILEEKGYKIKKVEFSDLLQSEIALVEGAIDFNVAQHTAYAESFNKEKNAELIPIVHIPTVPAGIYSNRYKSINEVREGAKIAIPKDPSNAARAYNLLNKAGWIKIKEGINPVKASINDIVSNPYNINIVEMESSQIPRALDDIDFGILPGSVVYFSKIDSSKLLLAEDIIKDFEIVVVVDKKNENSEWAKDIVSAYKSNDFKKYLEENNKNNYWTIPDELK